MRMSVVVAAALVLIPVLAATQADEKQKTLDELRGSWQIVKSEPNLGIKQLVFAGDKLTVVLGENDQQTGTVKLDPKAKPAHIDVDNGQEKVLGIYEVSGDTLRLCIATKGDKRPTEFKAGENDLLLTLKREKPPQPPRPVTDAERKEAERLAGPWYVISASAAGVTIPWMDLKDAEVSIQGQELTFKKFLRTGTRTSFFRVGEEQPARRPVLKTIASVEIAVEFKESPPFPVRLDVTTNPKGIDLQIKQVNLSGIYTLENDQLRIALADPGSDRPTELTPDPKRLVLVLDRKKPDVEKLQLASRREQERLQGAWTVTSGSYDTFKLSDQDRQGFRLIFGNDGLKWEEAGAVETLAAQLDPQAIPAAIDLTITGGPNQGRTIRGSYQLEKNQLLLRLPASFSLDRPRDLKQALGVDAVLTLKRSNP